MDTSKLKTWLNALKNTINFETVATQVFNRLIHGTGPGLLVIYGPPHDPPWPDEKKGNKTYFLNVVEALQHGCPDMVQEFVSPELWALLSRLNLISADLLSLAPRHNESAYQCINIVNIIKEFKLEPGTANFRIPLGVTTSVALALAATKVKPFGQEQEEGRWSSNIGGNSVILCDDLPRFMEYNTEANEQFLIELSHIINDRREMTFLATARLKGDDYWQGLLGPEHVLNLGWD